MVIAPVYFSTLLKHLKVYVRTTTDAAVAVVAFYFLLVFFIIFYSTSFFLVDASRVCFCGSRQQHERNGATLVETWTNGGWPTRREKGFESCFKYKGHVEGKAPDLLLH